jgi:hypothetical protein
VHIVPVLSSHAFEVLALIGSESSYTHYALIFGMMLQTVDIPRWQLVYLKPYKFSNVSHTAVMELPPDVQKLMNWANTTAHGPFNSAIVNWYENGAHYIGPHRYNTCAVYRAH